MAVRNILIIFLLLHGVSESTRILSMISMYWILRHCPLMISTCVPPQGLRTWWYSFENNSIWKHNQIKIFCCLTHRIDKIDAIKFISILLDVTMPLSILCSSKDCGHVVDYGKHFDANAWAIWTAANDTMTGTANYLLQSIIL